MAKSRTSLLEQDTRAGDVNSDKGFLNTIIINLISNAFKIYSRRTEYQD